MAGPFITDVCASPFTFSNFWANWEAVCFLALTTMATLFGLLYMASEVFRVPQMQAWVKFELFQLFATAFIVIMIVAIVSGMCSVKSDWVTNKSADANKSMFDGAKDYLFWLRNQAAKTWSYVAFINGIIQRLANITWVDRPAGFGYAITPSAGFTVYSSGASIAFSSLMLVMLTTIAQINVLQYIYIAFPGILLPLGVLFRCIAPTRQFGGMLLGLTVGFFLLYPMLLLLNDAVTRPVIDSYLGVTAASPAGNAIDNLKIILHMGTNEELANQDLAKSQETVTPVGPAGTPASAASPFNTNTSQESGATEYNAATSVAWYLRLAFALLTAGILLPAINFIVLITAVRELTRFFGEEIDVSSMTRMI